MERGTVMAAAGLVTLLALVLGGLAITHAAAAEPVLPAISGLYSPSHQDPAKWYGSRSVSFAWAPLFSVAGYSYAFDQDPATAPDGTLDPAIAPGFAPRVDYPAGPNPRAVTLGDFNDDGRPDLAVANGDVDTIGLRLNDGAGGFAVKATFPVGGDPDSIAAGDFNGDGRLDLVTADYQSHDVTVLLGDGAGGFGGKTAYRSGAGPYSVAVADFNGDSIADLVVANLDSSTVSVLLGNGDGGFAPKVDHKTDDAPLTVAVADFDQDGKPDVTTANLQGSVSVLPGNGDGSFGPRTDYPASLEPESIAAGDLNGDGNADLAIAIDGKASIRLGDGKGGFGRRIDYHAGGDSRAIAIGDLTGDGNADVVVATGWLDTVCVLPGDGSGRFGRGTQFATGDRTTPYSMSESIAIGDYDGDGLLDLAVSNGIFNRLSVLFNGKGTTETAASDGLWYFHVSAADGLGGVGPTETLAVRIDTCGPVTSGKSASGRRGHAIALRYKISDALSPKATFIRIVVRNSRDGAVKTIRPTTKATGEWYSAQWTPRAGGTFRYYVRARDLAGNPQSVKGSARVVVR